jgi:transcriptional regulator with XRE-family HTH domain
MSVSDIVRARQIIGRRIEAARREKGLSQQQLADMLGVDDQTVAAWEDARSAIGADRLAVLARIVDRRIGWLYNDDVAADVLLQDFDEETLATVLLEKIRQRNLSRPL